ncbi:MAG: tetratricopeptide repeat protein [Deltaproteobacteria bacterium]|nr:tetratricopeptide repeat protein [Deltaproteobacteria bacterium]
MNTPFSSGTARILCAALLMLLFTANGASAASWRWSLAASGRERLQITLDAPDAGLTVIRTGTRSLGIHLTEASRLSPQPAPEQAKLFTGAMRQGTRIELALSTPAFGYIVLRPSPVQVIVDVYPDPLGNHWRPPDAPVAETAAVRRGAPPALASAPVSTPVSAADEAQPAASTWLYETFISKAFAAPSAAPSAGERGARMNPQAIRAGINKAGPEAWPEDRALSSGPAAQQGPSVSAPMAPPPGTQGPALSGSAAPPSTGRASTTTPQQTPGKVVSLPPLPEELQKPSSSQLPPMPQAQQGQRQPASQAPQTARQAAAPQAQTPSTPDNTGAQVMGQAKGPQPPSANATSASANATAPVVYVDSKGNPVPKPLDPEELMAQAAASMGQKEYSAALETLKTLKGMPLPRDQKEKVLYLISDATWELYKDKPLEGYEHIVSVTNEAVHANLRSPNVPNAMLRLGEINLLVGNLREAEAYISARRTAYPSSSEVPVSFLKLGLAQLQDKQYAKAAATFRDIVQNYPDTPVLGTASASLAKALAALQEMREAGIVLDFVERRWPRHYLDDPAFLLLQAEYSLLQNKLQEALQQYWLYYNLEPGKPGNDKILLQIGDIYLRQGRTQPALDVFEEIPRRYPDSEGADYALLRLAEKGIHDGPAITREEMFAVFDNPGVPAPQVAYARLKRKNPHNAIGALSSLKLVLWQLWDKRYVDAIGMATDYIDMHPEEPGASLARQVLLEAFAHEEKMALQEENYGRILKLWNGFPLFRAKYTPLSDQMRVALAKAYLERGEENAAIELLSHFLQGPKNPQYGEYAFTFFFNRHLAAGDWSGILDLGERVADWEFPTRMRNELDYAMALSAENLGLPRKALPLWQKLAARDDIPLYEKAYATYFLAKDAERRKDIKDAYDYNKSVLGLFSRLEDERSDKADPERVKEAVASLMDICEVANRIPEALDWVERYNAFVPEGSPEYAGVRFRESRLYRKLGDAAKSRALLEQLVRTDPASPFGKAAASELRTFDVSRDLDRFTPRQ